MSEKKYYFWNFYIPLTSAMAIVSLLVFLYVPNPKRIDLAINTVLVVPALATILVAFLDRYDRN